jgi:peptidyl-prolyl cis-trans isomerase A (cyclophilin A)
MILYSKNLFFYLLLTSLFTLTPSLGLAQDNPTTPTPAATPVVTEKQATAPEKSLLQKAKEKASAAAEAAKEKAAAIKKSTLEAAEAAKVKAAAAAEAAKAKASAAAEATKAAASAAAEAAKAKASAAAEAIKTNTKKAVEATSKLVEEAKAKTIGTPAPVEKEAQPEPKIDLKPKVKFTTNMGDFIVELDAEKAPVTVKNFMAYVDGGFYANTIFHRVISNFMIQGGGFTADMNQKTTQAPIVLEARNGLSNLRGTIAMARTNNPNSATSQFFINVQNNRNLDSFGGGYAVFGKVIEGMETVDKIRNVQTAPKAGHRNVPVDTVVIQSATRL